MRACVCVSLSLFRSSSRRWTLAASSTAAPAYRQKISRRCQQPRQIHLVHLRTALRLCNGGVCLMVVCVFVSCRKMLQSLGRAELHMALEVCMVSGSGQEHSGCLLLSGEVLFVVSVCEDAQQQAFPITEIQCEHDTHTPGRITLTLQQHRVASDTEVKDEIELLPQYLFCNRLQIIKKHQQSF